MITAKAPATAPSMIAIKLSSSSTTRTPGVVLSTQTGGKCTNNRSLACLGTSPSSQTMTNSGYFASGRSPSGAEIDISPSELILNRLKMSNA